MSILSKFFGIKNVIIPSEGPKAVAANLDFSDGNSIEIDGLLITQSDAIEFIQGAYIDNGDNENPLEIYMPYTQQTITVRPRSQGYYPLLIGNPPNLTVSTIAAPNLRVRMLFYNVPISVGNWDVDAPQSVSGPSLSNYSLELDGTSQAVIAAGEASNYLLIFNPLGNDDIIVDLSGGDALSDGITLPAQGSIELDKGVANAITVSGTNTQNIIVYGG